MAVLTAANGDDSMSPMRTTVTLDADTEALIREEMGKRRLSFKAALNEAVRQGLKRATPRGKERRYRVQTFSSGFQPGIDPTKLNQLADQLEAEEYLRRSQKRRPRKRSTLVETPLQGGVAPR